MATLTFNDETFHVVDIFEHNLTVPDCIVAKPNKIGSGNGEKKFYIASKDEMRSFFGNSGFQVKCFVAKKDLLKYLSDMKSEYDSPSQTYREKNKLPQLWKDRQTEIQKLDEIIEFDMFDQTQIAGPRGYVNTEIRKDQKTLVSGDRKGYRLITDIALPLVSYIKIMKLKTSQGTPVFYWKLFADFDAIENKQDALVYTYGKGKKTEQNQETPSSITEYQDNVNKARKGQGKYRDDLLKECWYCPFTRITEPELLIASHIKPWRDCETDEEKLDPKNGLALSPLYDKLFDRGFMSFEDDKRVKISNWFSKQTQKVIGLEEGQFIQDLPLDEKRKYYMEYHRNNVFQG